MSRKVSVLLHLGIDFIPSKVDSIHLEYWRELHKKKFNEVEKIDVFFSRKSLRDFVDPDLH